MIKEFFSTNGVAFRPLEIRFEKNDWFKTLMRLKTHFTGIPIDDFADARTRKWMEMVRDILPPEPQHFPKRAQ
jgi:hypothetical protein